MVWALPSFWEVPRDGEGLCLVIFFTAATRPSPDLYNEGAGLNDFSRSS